MHSRLVRYISLLVIFALTSTTLFGCSKKGTTGPSSNAGTVTLTIWRSQDSADSFEQLIKNYQQEHKNVNINYVYKESWKDNPSQYLQETIDALATGKGPDIWSVRNDWLAAQYQKTIPIADGALAKSGYVKDVATDGKTNAQIVKSIFVPTVYDDAVFGGKVYGLPLFTDSMALYVNKTIMEKAIEEVTSSNSVSSRLLPKEVTTLRKILSSGPKDWTELVKIVPYLTVKQGNTVSRSAIALGLGENIEQSANIISSLMLQNGTEIVSPDRLSAYFQNAQTTSTGGSAYTGRAAIDFYTGFATPGKSVYTWNRDFSTSARQAFLDNKLAMLVDDSQFYSTIKSSQAKYSFDVIPLPQLSTDNPRTYASYWLETVTSNSKNSAQAWDFLAYATTNGSNNQAYLSNTKKAPALLSKTEDFHSDAAGLSVFKAQARIARSWYKGPQPNTADMILAQWADNIVINGKTNTEATSVAAGQLTTMLQSVTPPPAADVATSTTTTTNK